MTLAKFETPRAYGYLYVYVYVYYIYIYTYICIYIYIHIYIYKKHHIKYLIFLGPFHLLVAKFP